MRAQWFGGICDELLVKIGVWNSFYWAGEIHSTRKYMSPRIGEGVIDKPTRCAHKIPFRLTELEHLVRIATEAKPNSEIVRELEGIKGLWKKGQAVQGNRYNQGLWKKIVLPAGLHRIITIAFYPEHAKEILEMLLEAKNGSQTVTFEKAVAEKATEGKSIFEI